MQRLAWRSMWEVADDLRTGRLVSVLDEWCAPDNAIYAVFAQRRHLALRVRLFIEFLKERYGSVEYWRNGTAEVPAMDR